jgi:hypothetical protein
MTPAEAARLVIMAAVVPLWIAAGLADWACHRASAIERTAGLRENVFHWVLLGQAGVALVATALLEVDAAVLLLVLAAWVAHELTTWVELRYAAPRRTIRPIEQMVHSFMEILPLGLLALLAVMRSDQVAAMFGHGAADWSLRWKERPWPVAYLVGAGAGVLLLNLLPIAQETLRCWRARQGVGVRSSPRPTGERRAR